MKGQANSSVLLENLLGEPNGKLGREDIFILTVVIENVHGANNDGSVRTVNFASSNYQIFKIMMLQCQNIHKYICPFHQ
jgi:hypothetical protein